jgi:hypothetical protein
MFICDCWDCAVPPDDMPAAAAAARLALTHGVSSFTQSNICTVTAAIQRLADWCSSTNTPLFGS